jgi:transposase-like protein
MEPKKDSDRSKAKREVVRTTKEVKKEIISKHENGVRVSDLAMKFGVTKSTINSPSKQ